MEILKTTIIGLFFGTFGTTLGGIIGVVIKKNSNKFLSFILSFASRTYDSNYLFRINSRSTRDRQFANSNFRYSVWNNYDDIL